MKILYYLSPYGTFYPEKLVKDDFIRRSIPDPEKLVLVNSQFT